MFDVGVILGRMITQSTLCFDRVVLSQIQSAYFSLFTLCIGECERLCSLLLLTVLPFMKTDTFGGIAILQYIMRNADFSRLIILHSRHRIRSLKHVRIGGGINRLHTFSMPIIDRLFRLGDQIIVLSGSRRVIQQIANHFFLYGRNFRDTHLRFSGFFQSFFFRTFDDAIDEFLIAGGGRWGAFHSAQSMQRVMTNEYKKHDRSERSSKKWLTEATILMHRNYAFFFLGFML